MQFVMRMPSLRRALAVVAMAMMVTGCAQLQSTWQKIETAYEVVTTQEISPRAVYVARNAFNAVEVTATQYLKLRRCDGSNAPICRDPAVTPKLIATVRSGRLARNDLTKFMKDHPGQLGPRGLYDALVGATNTISDMLAEYKANVK